jgi:hypothetical protein
MRRVDHATAPIAQHGEIGALADDVDMVARQGIQFGPACRSLLAADVKPDTLGK